MKFLPYLTKRMLVRQFLRLSYVARDLFLILAKTNPAKHGIGLVKACICFRVSGLFCGPFRWVLRCVGISSRVREFLLHSSLLKFLVV